MERSSKRGKIPQQDWPSIIARYEGGETLASIARTYDCSPPAISYILSRSRARATAAALAGVPSPENPAAAPPQGGGSLFEARLAAPAAPADSPSENAAFPLPEPNAAAKTDVSPPRFSAPPGNGRAGNGAPVTGGPGNGGLGNGAPNGELRRTLRLSSGSANGPERNGEARNGGTLSGFGVRPPARAPGAAEPPYPQPLRPSAQSPAPYSPGAHSPGNGAPLRVLAESPQPKEGGGALDQVLRERVHADLAAFLAAFDAALADDTSESRTGLREATDRLLRAGARTRIELERLEARLPLPGREAPAAAMPYWRQR